MTQRNFGIHQSRFAPLPSPDAARSATAAVKASPRAAVANIQTVRPALGGIKPRASRHDAKQYNRADPSNIPLPSGSLSDPGGYSLESHDVADADRDRIAMIGAISFVLCVCALFLGLRALSVYFFA